jgi:hypothetical protein
MIELNIHIILKSFCEKNPSDTFIDTHIYCLSMQRNLFIKKELFAKQGIVNPNLSDKNIIKYMSTIFRKKILVLQKKPSIFYLLLSFET